MKQTKIQYLLEEITTVIDLDCHIIVTKQGETQNRLLMLSQQ